MFKQVFQTEIVPYRQPWAGIPGGIGLQSLYNPYLVAAPREYAEEFTNPWILYSERTETIFGPTTISMLAWTKRIYWPGWEILLYKFDGITGQFLSRQPVPWGAVEAAWTGEIVQGFDGRLWRTYLQDMHELSDDLSSVLRVIPASRFGRIACNLPAVDVMNDTVVMAAESGQTAIVVYRLSTGEKLRTINTSDAPGYLCPERKGRVFVLGKNKLLLNLINFETGEIMATWKCPSPAGAKKVMLSWDVVYRRLLVFGWMPDAENGASLSRVTGYYPLPVATNLCKPIPLKVPRKGRVIPVLTRVIGDAGEPVMSTVVSATATGAGRVSGFGAQLVADSGYAALPIECTDQGVAEVSMSVTA